MPAPPDQVRRRVVRLAHYGSSSAVPGEPPRGRSPFGDHCPPDREPSLPRKRYATLRTLKPSVQVRTCGSSLALQLGPVLLALEQVGVDLGLVIQIKGNSAVDVR